MWGRVGEESSMIRQLWLAYQQSPKQDLTRQQIPIDEKDRHDLLQNRLTFDRPTLPFWAARHSMRLFFLGVLPREHQTLCIDAVRSLASVSTPLPCALLKLGQSLVQGWYKSMQ